jgi:hypothetical protein
VTARPRRPASNRLGPEPCSFETYTVPVSVVNGQWVNGRGGANGNIYPDTDCVGVVLRHHDDGVPIPRICLRQLDVVTGGQSTHLRRLTRGRPPDI